MFAVRGGLLALGFELVVVLPTANVDSGINTQPNSREHRPDYRVKCPYCCGSGVYHRFHLHVMDLPKRIAFTVLSPNMDYRFQARVLSRLRTKASKGNILERVRLLRAQFANFVRNFHSEPSPDISKELLLRF